MICRHAVLMIVSSLLVTLALGCSKGPSAAEQRRQLQELDPNPPVEATAAAEFITVEETKAEGEPPMTILEITCSVTKAGILTAEWPTTGGQTESREVVIQDDGSGQATLIIPDVRCIRGQKVTLKPKP